MPVVAVLLEALGIPFTGASSLSLWRCLLSRSKLVAKQRLLDQEISTPVWLTLRGRKVGKVPMRKLQSEKAIVKAIAEHASLGLEHG